MMGEKKTCAASVTDRDGWDTYDCMNPAKYGDYCGVHSPEQKKKRAEARGPTQYELDMAARRSEQERVKALESSHADLLEALETILMMIPLPSLTNTQDSVRLANIANISARAIKRAEEVK